MNRFRVAFVYCCAEHGMQMLILDPKTHLPVAAMPFTQQEVAEMSKQFRKAEAAMNANMN